MGNSLFKSVRAFIALAAVAVGLSGCLSISPPNIDMSSSVTTQNGSPFCDTSADGKMVACGGKAPFCAKSADGKMVACGGAAPFCDKSPDGKMVACGGPQVRQN